MTEINKETLEAIGFIFDKEEFEFFKPQFERISYYSPCRRFVITKDNEGNNISYSNAWSLHVDNSDMCTLASCQVEFIEQVLVIMELYKNY